MREEKNKSDVDIDKSKIDTDSSKLDFDKEEVDKNIEKDINKKKKKSFKNKIIDLIFSLVILIGILIMVYPLISQYYYRSKSSVDLDAYKEGVKQLSEEEIKERMLLARAYNEDLSLSQLELDIKDPFADEIKDEARAEYAKMIEVHKLIGTLTIPKIAQELPVYAGTSEVVLQKGVGHMEGTSLPIGGINSHSVVTAHRGLPNARLFTDLDKLSEGDRFYYKNIKETIAYQVYEVETIEPSNFDALMITENEDRFTLLTCTPYMINSHRLLVKGKRIPYNPELEYEDIRKGKNYRYLVYAIFALVILLIILILLIFKKRRKYKQLEQRLKLLELELEKSEEILEEENILVKEEKPNKDKEK